MQHTLKEMQNICNEIHAGTHPFCAINQKETLRCINEANIMFRDTLRDIDEGECCSEASESPKKHRKPKKKKALAAREKQGQVPTLDLLRIWDTGASQGMVDKAVVSSKNAFTGDEVSICTGNGTISSRKYENCEIAPGVRQVHVSLPNTANTVSLGSINSECHVGFQWLQPLSQNIGCAFGFQALAPTDIDATLHADRKSVV